MKSTSALIAFAVATTVASSPVLRRTSHPTVTDPSNQISYIGNSSDGVESFFNIRFGRDTSGDNRFKAPQPFVYPSSTVVNATTPGPVCPQQKVPISSFPIFDNVTDISEDCLTLRIDRPENTTSGAKLPVLAWIYGGGFNIGQIYDSVYTPTGLVLGAAAKNTPVIYVAMNYRVGLFGFAASPGMSPDDLNNGLLDQRLAFEWIQQNIRLFGGDPENVTIFGESAGAASVGLHLLSYAGNATMRPSFQRAIIQSGGPTSQLGMTGPQTANTTANVISLVNCSSATSNYTEELSCLRAVPLDTLTEVSTNYSLSLDPLGGFDAYSPVAPSTYIPDAPSTLVSEGRFHKSISLISGWTENDGSLFTPDSISTESDVQTWLEASNLTSSAVQEVLTLYPSTSFSDLPSENKTAQWFRASQIDRDRGNTCPNLLINSAMANCSSTNTTNYLYALNSTLYTPFFQRLNATYLGVSHLSDVPYVFNQALYPLYQASEANIALSSAISGSWAAFATTGNPDAGSNTTVTPWTQAAQANSSSSFAVRTLGGPRDGMAVISDTDTETDMSLQAYDEDLIRRCAFWNSIEVLQMNGT